MKTLSKLIVTIVLSSLSIINESGCDWIEGPVPATHSFKWEIDTLFEGSVRFFPCCMWGSSSSNMYLGGVDDYMNSPLLHWDGRSWSRVDLKGRTSRVDFISGCDSTYAVAGWEVKHQWGEVVSIDHGRVATLIPRGVKRGFNAGTVISRDEIYLGGVDGVFKYSGQRLATLLDSSNSYVDPNTAIQMFDPNYILKMSDGTLYMTSQKDNIDWSVSIYLWKMINGRFEVLDSTTSAEWKFGWMLYEYNGRLLSTARGLKVLSGTQWLLMSNVNKEPVTYISGGTRNLLLVANGRIYHYNGEQCEDVTPPEFANFEPNYQITQLVLCDSVAFIAILDHGRCYIARATHC